MAVWYVLLSENEISLQPGRKLLIIKRTDVLTVNGRSYSSPVYKEGTSEVDMAASRRVEIKFRLKEDEMIEKINEVLNES